jgi:hypothetical protein
MDDTFHHIKLLEKMANALERFANAQERLLAIAEEARKERNALSDQMKKAFRQPLEEK